MALKKKKVNTIVEGTETEIPKEVTLKAKVGTPNISQAGLIRALKKRGFQSTNNENPFVFENPDIPATVSIHTDKVTVADTDISVPLGKGAIDKLMEQVNTK